MLRKWRRTAAEGLYRFYRRSQDLKCLDENRSFWMRIIIKRGKEGIGEELHRGAYGLEKERKCKGDERVSKLHADCCPPVQSLHCQPRSVLVPKDSNDAGGGGM